MDCTKKSFDSALEANLRAGEINSENSKKKKFPIQIRDYKCPKCDKWHLTSMQKGKFKQNEKFKTDLKYRNKLREKAFIRRESEYWNEYFGA